MEAKPGLETSTCPDSEAPIFPLCPAAPVHFHRASDVAGPQPGTHRSEQQGLKTGALRVAWAVPHSPGSDSQPWKDNRMGHRPVRGGTCVSTQRHAGHSEPSRGPCSSCQRPCLAPRLLSLHHAVHVLDVSGHLSSLLCLLSPLELHPGTSQ